MKLIIITIAILIISGITLATFRNYIDEVNVSRESDVSELGGLREYVGSSLTKLSNDLIAKSDMIYNNIPLRKNAISRHGTIMERVEALDTKLDNAYVAFKSIDAKLDNAYAIQKAQVMKNGWGFKALDDKIDKVYALQKAQAIKNGGGFDTLVVGPAPLPTTVRNTSVPRKGYPPSTAWNINGWDRARYHGLPEGHVRRLCSNHCNKAKFTFYTIATSTRTASVEGCGCSKAADQMQQFRFPTSNTIMTRRVVN